MPMNLVMREDLEAAIVIMNDSDFLDDDIDLELENKPLWEAFVEGIMQINEDEYLDDLCKISEVPYNVYENVANSKALSQMDCPVEGETTEKVVEEEKEEETKTDVPKDKKVKLNPPPDKKKKDKKSKKKKAEKKEKKSTKKVEEPEEEVVEEEKEEVVEEEKVEETEDEEEEVLEEKPKKNKRGKKQKMGGKSAYYRIAEIITECVVFEKKKFQWKEILPMQKVQSMMKEEGYTVSETYVKDQYNNNVRSFDVLFEKQKEIFKK